MSEIFDKLGMNDTLFDNANNIQLGETNKTLQYNQSVDVILPKEELNDSTVAIRTSKINRVLNECKRVKRNRFSWAELFLGISTLLLGAFISAIISKVEYTLGFLNVILYTVCPGLGMCLMAMYIFTRKNEIKDASSLAEVVEENIVLPDELREER